jgi:hypothetical protein
LMLLMGLASLAVAGAGAYVALSGGGALHLVMEGARAAFFASCGLSIVTLALLSDAEAAKVFVREYVRDVFSRRNLTEFALFWVVVGLAVAVLLIVR